MTAAVTVPPTTPPGPYTVTLQATTSAGPAPSTQSFTLNVVLNPDFILSEPSPFPNVKAGGTGTSGLIDIASQDGFSDTVMLSCAGIFGNSSCSIVPSTVSSFPSTATLTINATNASAGAYQIAVQGTSGSITNTYEVPFDVGDYTISGTQTLSASPAGSATANLTLTSTYGYSGQINATCDASSLAGTQCTLSPANPVTINADAATALKASFNITNNAAPGTYPIKIDTQDVSGTPSHTWAISLSVGQDFTLSTPTPASQTIAPGETASYNFNVFPVGASFTDAVTFSCSGAPGPCTFSPSSVTPGNSSAAIVMTINTTASSADLFRFRGRAIFYALWLALPALAIFGSRRRSQKCRRSLHASSLLALFALALLLNSCGAGGTNGGGGGGGTPGNQQQGTQPGTYPITVNGTSGPVSHRSSPVKLIVSGS